MLIKMIVIWFARLRAMRAIGALDSSMACLSKLAVDENENVSTGAHMVLVQIESKKYVQTERVLADLEKQCVGEKE